MQIPRTVLRVVVEIMVRRRVVLMRLGLALCYIEFLSRDYFEYMIQYIYGM